MFQRLRKYEGDKFVFPFSLKVPANANKAFMCSTNGGPEKALSLAVQYRDIVVSHLIKTLY